MEARVAADDWPAVASSARAGAATRKASIASPSFRRLNSRSDKLRAELPQQQQQNAEIALPEPLALSSALDAALAIVQMRNQLNLSDVSSSLAHALRPSRLRHLLQKHQPSYQAAKPFPHTIIDGLFPEEVMSALSREISQRYSKFHGHCTRIGWNLSIPVYCSRISGKEERKSGLTHEELMGPTTLLVMRALKSVEIVRFLRELSGLERKLHADPAYNGAGVHLVAPKGKLNLHADFNRYREYNLDRRVNTFLYLNHDWPASYGGHLELWNKELTQCEQRILPRWNRYVAPLPAERFPLLPGM